MGIDLLPVIQNIELLQNWNKLKTSLISRIILIKMIIIPKVNYILCMMQFSLLINLGKKYNKCAQMQLSFRINTNINWMTLSFLMAQVKAPDSL